MPRTTIRGMANFEDTVQKLIDVADLGLDVVKKSLGQEEKAVNLSEFTLRLLESCVTALDAAKELMPPR